MTPLNLQVCQYARQSFLAEGSDLVGGAGWYYHHDYYQRGEQVAQTPYVHMDVRGYTRPDGSLVRWVGEDALESERKG